MYQFEIESLVFRRSLRFTLEIGELLLGDGEKVAVVGPNGSGKTTLLRVLSCLEKADSWKRFLFRGKPVPVGRGVMDRTGLGFLRQQPVLFRGSVEENLAYPLKVRRRPAAEIRKAVEAMLGLMELRPLAGVPAHHLSVGEQRRVALGRVLIGGRRTLLLDEPVAHMDARSRAIIEDVLDRTGETILMTTHDLGFAQRTAERVLGLEGGRITESLPLNILSGKVKGRKLAAGSGLTIPLPDSADLRNTREATVRIDPKGLIVSALTDGSSDMNGVGGPILSVREHGEEVWLEVDCGYRMTVVVARAVYEKEGLNVRRDVVLSFGPDAVHLL